MHRGTATLLQLSIILIGVGAFVFMLFEPHVEGRNEHATLTQIYFNDPFLAFAYTASLPLFYGLYLIFTILTHVKNNMPFSETTLRASRTLKRCAITLMCFALVGAVWIMHMESDDRSGGFFMSVLVMIGAAIIKTGAGTFERQATKRLSHPQTPTNPAF